MKKIIEGNIKRALSAKRLLCVVALLCAPLSFAERSEAGEYALKAAYLYNFTKFVLWPDEKSEAIKTAINICIKGDMPRRDIVSQIQQRQTRGRPLKILPFNRISTVDECHVLYFHNLSAKAIESAVRLVGDKPILTVGEHKGFASKEGDIEFVFDAGRIKLMINHQRAKKRGIHMSAQLLEVASVVSDLEHM